LRLPNCLEFPIKTLFFDKIPQNTTERKWATSYIENILTISIGVRVFFGKF